MGDVDGHGNPDRQDAPQPERAPVDLDALAGGRSITISGPLGKVVLVLVVGFGLFVGVAFVIWSWI
jgi:hypothetical protein